MLSVRDKIPLSRPFFCVHICSDPSVIALGYPWYILGLSLVPIRLSAIWFKDNPNRV